ncbi:MAG: hypothetical protein KU37_03710 [Sulfuricurvum sp. PC08-66]|nr:MAG: hypothetical protein KU37_03710 [Sulfuricurvum sp. PC08-66]
MSPLHEQLQELKNQNNLYTKEHKSFQEQLEKLLNRHLIVPNHSYALSKLEHINYYRLSAYFLPYQYPKESQNTNLFLPNTTFENIIKLYYFDTELRKILFEAIEAIEIYLRTQIAYYHSQKYGAFGYLDIQTLRPNYQKEFDALHQDIIEEKERSKEVFIKHFQDKYNAADLPIWSVVEILSFGSLSKLFMLLQESEQNKVIAKMGNINKVIFVKWFKALSSVRNACAHHSRLWNKTLGVGFEVPRNNPTFAPLSPSTKKVFFALSVIEYILARIGEDEIDFKNKVKQLLQKYPHVDKEAMGLVEGWEDLEIWR